MVPICTFIHIGCVLFPLKIKATAFFSRCSVHSCSCLTHTMYSSQSKPTGIMHHIDWSGCHLEPILLSQKTNGIYKMLGFFKGNCRNTINSVNGIFISVMPIEKLVINVLIFLVSLEDIMRLW